MTERLHVSAPVPCAWGGVCSTGERRVGCGVRVYLRIYVCWYFWPQSVHFHVLWEVSMCLRVSEGICLNAGCASASPV